MRDAVTNGLLELRIGPGAGAGFLVGRYIGTNDSLRVEFVVYFLTVNGLTWAVMGKPLRRIRTVGPTQGVHGNEAIRRECTLENRIDL